MPEPHLLALPPNVCGIDEAGRGPLAGPVVAAAVLVLADGNVLADGVGGIVGLNDSKKLSARRREALALEIRAKAAAWCIGVASPEEIDRLNILNATFLAMQRAVAGLSRPALGAVVDGNRCPPLPIPVTAVVKGDAKIAAIAAASILAKTARDAMMRELHQRFPHYGFDRHMGYPTPAHLAALETFGPCPEHRRSFAPVRDLRLF
jgi:ribonuclease HII